MTREELYDKCENMEELYDNFYYPLLVENQELKLQLKGTTHCFDEEEHEKLKKQLEELKEEKQEWINLLAMFKNQQKEFIKYLEDNYKETQDIWYIKILQKYKSIIGVSDDKTN